jgi:hypothetical protein
MNRQRSKSSCRSTAVTVTVVLLLVSPFAGAGDEVNYSAPYLVVENGELLTKYPAREHTGTEEKDLAPAESRTPAKWWLAALAGAAAAVGVGCVAQRQRRRPVMRDADR